MNPTVSQSSIHAPIEEYEGLSPRVNGSLLPLFIGLFVTLPCRIATKNAGQMTVITSDGSEVIVHMLAANREVSAFSSFLVALTPIILDYQATNKVSGNNGEGL